MWKVQSAKKVETNKNVKILLIISAQQKQNEYKYETNKEKMRYTNERNVCEL